MSAADLAGRTALVTGSVRGLGLAVARALAAAGCNVVLNGFDAESDVGAIVAGLESQFAIGARYCGADLRNPSEIARMIDEACRLSGAVDILVNNAVVRHVAPVESFAPGAWDEALAVNLSAAFHAIRLAVPAMKSRRWGRIVNMSSIYGLRATVDRVAYVTTKTALIGLTRAVAMETVREGITCNAICPGTTATPIHEQALHTLTAHGLPRSDAEARFFAGKQPSGRFVDAGGVAALTRFLCSDAARDITGAVLPVDGAWSAG
jgi:3-hydroxybutyrate dehydrogenase